MSRTPNIAEASPQTCLYDALLNEYLPIIHQAARSACDNQHPGFCSHLLLAGLQGLKDAFMHAGEANRDISSEMVTHRIYYAMRQQIEINPLN